MPSVLDPCISCITSFLHTCHSSKSNLHIIILLPSICTKLLANVLTSFNLTAPLSSFLQHVAKLALNTWQGLNDLVCRRLRSPHVQTVNPHDTNMYLSNFQHTAASISCIAFKLLVLYQSWHNWSLANKVRKSSFNTTASYRHRAIILNDFKAVDL